MGLYTNADDPLDTLRRTANASTGPGAIPPPPIPPTGGGVPPVPPSGASPGATVPPTGTTAPSVAETAKPKFFSSKVATQINGSKLAKGAASLLNPVNPLTFIGGAGYGAAQSIGDTLNGYRDQFANSVGADGGLISSIAADAARTAESVGNGLTGGVAGRIGRGISSKLNGDSYADLIARGGGSLLQGFMSGTGSFMDGFTSDTARDQFLEKQASSAGPLARAAGATPQQPKTPAQINADEAAKKVSAAVAANPQLGGVQPDNRQITQLSGGQFANPMFTDDADRAIREASRNPINDPRLAIKRQIIGDDGLPQTYTYTPDDNKASPSQSYGPLQTRAMGTVQQAGDRINVMPSTAASDKAYLNGAFARHIASGDLDRARATIDPNNEAQQAQFGAAENAQVSARNAAYSAAPEQRMLQDYIQSKIDADKRGGGIRDHAFGGPFRGGRGGQGGAAGLDPGIIAGLQASIAASKGQQTDPGKAAADALTAYNANQASKTNIIGQNLAQQGQQVMQDGQKVTQQNLLQLGALQKALISETDPTKRETLKENIQVLTGKYEKADKEPKATIVNIPTGPVDALTGKAPTTPYIWQDGELKDPASMIKKSATPPSREEIIAEAKKSFKNDSSAKARINAEAKQRFGFEPL